MENEQIGNEPAEEPATAAPAPKPGRIAVYCVGNKLYLDDGVGPAVCEEVLKRYDVPANVSISDVGCMSMDMLESVNENDLIITVDAVDGTGQPAGTVFRYSPEDMARNTQMRTSLHDLRLCDLFDAASLLGYEAQGLCIGVQIENRNPPEFIVGLTPPVYNALPLAIDMLAAELMRAGAPLVNKKTGLPVDRPERGLSQSGDWEPAPETEAGKSVEGGAAANGE